MGAVCEGGGWVSHPEREFLFWSAYLHNFELMLFPFS